jgi:hypothetical protein
MTYFRKKPSRPQGHSAVEMIKSTTSRNYTIGNRNRDLPTCSIVPQLNAPPRSVHLVSTILKCYLVIVTCSLMLT